MFGHHGDNDVIQPDPDNSGTAISDVASPTPINDDASVTHTDNQSWQHPGDPIDSDSPTTATVSQFTPSEPSTTASAPAIAPVEETQDEPKEPAETEKKVDPADVKPFDEIVDLSSQELIDLKQKALGELSPLMSHLDQSPEEKFRTTMMMIQASDDQTLIKPAYEAAKQITDEKTRAQALLDIVNEINYFTQQSEK